MTDNTEHLTTNLNKINKIALKAMYANGYLDTSELERANEIAGLMNETKYQQNQLMGFLLAMSKNSYCQEIVKRAVEAKNHGAETAKIRINFNWSNNRWEEEYTRAERMQHVTAVANKYKDKEFPNFRNNCLHPAFRKILEKNNMQGALIETPIRLAMEGLKQNHCVGGSEYIEKAGTGNYCFVSVVAKKKRWTCEIVLYDNGKAIISNVLGKNNKTPSEDERLTINHKLLGSTEREKVKFSGRICLNVEDFELEVPEGLREMYGTTRIDRVPNISAYINKALEKERKTITKTCKLSADSIDSLKLA